MKTLVTILLPVALFQFSHSAFSQEIPCRQWYFHGRNGNEQKTTCKEGWFENDIGQKHGKYSFPTNQTEGRGTIRVTSKRRIKK